MSRMRPEVGRVTWSATNWPLSKTSPTASGSATVGFAANEIGSNTFTASPEDAVGAGTRAGFTKLWMVPLMQTDSVVGALQPGASTGTEASGGLTWVSSPQEARSNATHT